VETEIRNRCCIDEVYEDKYCMKYEWQSCGIMKLKTFRFFSAKATNQNI
jgi:hypothetical protein